MPPTFTHRLHGGSTTDNQPTYTTTSITPATDGSPIGLWVLSIRSGASAAPTMTTVAGIGLTWTAVANFTSRDLGSFNLRLLLWKGIGTASTGPVVLTPASANNSGIAWQFVQMPGANPVTPFLTANKIESTLLTAQTSTSLTLPSTPTAGNAVLAAVSHLTAEDITAGTNFTRGTNINLASPAAGHNYEYKTASLTTTVDGSWATSAGYVAAGIEVAAASPGDSVGFIPF